MKLPMKLHRSILALATILFCIFPTDMHAVVNTIKSTEIIEKTVSKKELRKKARLERKKAKLKKKFNRLMKKIEERAQKNEHKLVNLWNDGKFRLGILLLLAAIAVGIIALLFLGGLLNFIAGLLALGGVVLILWSMVEYFA